MKISKKLTLSISAVIFVISILSIIINLFFVDRYYIYEKRKVLEKVSDELVGGNLNSEDLTSLEDDYGVAISTADINDELNKINGDIIYQFEKKKIRLNKFWITDEVLNSLENRSVNKIYDQGVAKYKVLTRFTKVEHYVLAIGMPLPHMKETIDIINRFNFLIMLISLIIIVALVHILSEKIVSPLETLKELSKEIAALNFKKIDITTKDEIGELAFSINKMSESLERAHNEINSQNKRLKQLLSDISHELKTPLALVRVYAGGIEDGLDDGTYMEIIKEQIDRMAMLIDKLLYWAKLDNDKLSKSTFNLESSIYDVAKKYKIMLEENNIKLNINIAEGNFIINADKEAIEVVLDNLISNSIKYTSNEKIDILLIKESEKSKFIIRNGIDKKALNNIEEIWTPFYVLEKSRNKNLSGTGLGLSIVESILKKHNFNFGFNIIDEEIEFYFEENNN